MPIVQPIRTGRSRLRLLVLGTLAVALATVSSVAAPPAHAAGPEGDPWVVSVGDSYISGEGGRWAGNSNRSERLVDAGGAAAYFDNADRTAESINRCHRSTAADIHLGGGVRSLNLACAGATTGTVARNSEGNFKPGLDFYSGPEGKGQALALQEFASTHRVRMVAVSIGGNDFRFADLVSDCVTAWATSTFLSKTYCASSPRMKTAVSPDNVSAVRAKIAAALRNIRTAMRAAGYADAAWTVMIQNYPSPLPQGSGFRYPQSGYTRQTTGGCGIWDSDADYVGTTLLPILNGAVFGAADDSGLTNVRLLDVAGAFAGRRLCEKGVNLVENAGPGISDWRSAGAADASEWITQVRTLSTTGTNYFVQESVHPNYWGQLALRNCLRQACNAGAPQSGTCTHGTGLTASQEPVMSLATTARGATPTW